jgi:autotransporter translocation and assembly factor TamB
MVRLDVSPDVVFTATPSLFNLDGKVDVPDVDRQVAVDRDPGALLINRLEVFVEHHFIRRHANDVSPDVVFTATPSLFNLDGKVDVPWARIVVNEVASLHQKTRQPRSPAPH